MEINLFTIPVDMDGYWQVRLDKSSVLSSFNTLSSRFKFQSLTLGIKLARKLFQHKNSETFRDVAGVHVIAVDMIIATSTQQGHDQILRKVTERAQAESIKFNQEKIKFMAKSS